MSVSEPSMTEDFCNPTTWENPYPAYSAWREKSPLIAKIPVVALDGTEVEAFSWLLLRHEDVFRVLRDHDTFSSDPPQFPNMPPRLPLIQDDPPRHASLRRLVNKAFTARRIAQLEPWIRQTAQESISEVGEGEVDVVESLAVPLPVKVIARLLGIGGDDYLSFKRWSDAFLSMNSSNFEPVERARNRNEMAEYLFRIIEERRSQSGSDLITALVEAEVDGERLDRPELLGFCILLLIAGNETTTNLIGNMLNLLANRPELWERLRGDRSLVEQTIEETLRYESPVQTLFRFVRRDSEIGSQRIFQNTSVAVSFGAANRDPDVFAHAEEFDIDRNWTSHMAFGGGIHYCLGAPLARVEAAVALNAMLDRYATISPGSVPGTRQRATNVILGFTRLMLEVDSD